jgi:hypothetical protein
MANSVMTLLGLLGGNRLSCATPSAVGDCVSALRSHPSSPTLRLYGSRAEPSTRSNR